MIGVALAVLLAAHGLIHGLYLVPAPPDSGAAWPFAIGRSWLAGRFGTQPAPLRTFVATTVGVVVVAFGMSAASVAGVLPAAWFGPAAVVGAAASVILLATMFQPRILLGFAIDAVLLWAVLGQGWTPALLD